jgi:hypothetical protein
VFPLNHSILSYLLSNKGMKDIFLKYSLFSIPVNQFPPPPPPPQTGCKFDLFPFYQFMIIMCIFTLFQAKKKKEKDYYVLTKTDL